MLSILADDFSMDVPYMKVLPSKSEEIKESTKGGRPPKAAGPPLWMRPKAASFIWWLGRSRAPPLVDSFTRWLGRWKAYQKHTDVYANVH